MKRNLSATIIAFTFLLFATIFLTSCGEQRATSLETLSDNCIRIHIRANSNSQEDQAVKLKVRDEVTSFLTQKLEGCKTKQEAMSLLAQNKQTIVKIADLTLKQSNFAYKTSIRLSREHFPERKYDSYVFPEGDYDALIVELGSGKGDNWWCVAFPPLCFVPNGNSGEKIVYKSWIKEMLDKLFH